MGLTDAIPEDRSRKKISTEWNIAVESFEARSRVTLSTFRKWYMPNGRFEDQKNITRLSKKIEQSLARERKGFRWIGDVNPFFSLGLMQEALNYERVLEKKFNLPILGIRTYTRERIEQFDSAAIELLQQCRSRVR